MKKSKLFLLVLAVVVLATSSLLAIPMMDNDPDNDSKSTKVNVKVVTIVDGVKTVKDTLIGFESDLDLKMLEDLEVNIDSILKVVEDKIQNISINCEMDGDDDDHFVINIGGEDMDLNFDLDVDNIEEIIEMSLEGIDSKSEITKKMVIRIDVADENIEFTTDDEEDLELELDLKELLKSIELDSEDVDSNVSKKSLIIKEYSTRPNAYDIKMLQDVGYTNVHKGNLELEQFSISPNPNQGKFTLAFESNSKETIKINVFDINGKNVYSEKLKNFEGQYSKSISIENEKPGAYFVTMKQDHKYLTRKFIKK